MIAMFVCENENSAVFYVFKLSIVKLIMRLTDMGNQNKYGLFRPISASHNCL
jgi:hypothetical protein